MLAEAGGFVHVPSIGSTRLWYQEDHSFANNMEKSSRKVAATLSYIENTNMPANRTLPASSGMGGTSVGDVGRLARILKLSHNGDDLYNLLPVSTRRKLEGLELKSITFVCTQPFYVTYCAVRSEEGECEVLVNSRGGWPLRGGGSSMHTAVLFFPHGDGTPSGVNVFVNEEGLKVGITGTVYTLTCQLDASKYTAIPTTTTPELGNLRLSSGVEMKIQ
jgi:hypothetical protein